MIKIAIVITSRASYSRVRNVLLALKKQKNIKSYLILASSVLLQKFGNFEEKIKDDGLIIEAKCFNLLEGSILSNSARSTALLINQLSDVFDRLQPEFVLTIADRYETLATAVAASYANISLIHLQGGEITGNIDEKVRHSVSKLADHHIVCTERSKEILIRMGEDPSCIINLGCPSIDIAKEVMDNKDIYLKKQIVKNEEKIGVMIDEKKDFIVALQHPVTTQYESTRDQIVETIQAVEELGMQCYWFWPNPDSGTDVISKELRKWREKSSLAKVAFVKDLSSKNFLGLLLKSKCLIGNSSVGIRESSFLGVPVVNIGYRQDGREKADNVINCSNKANDIVKSCKKIMEKKIKSSNLYGDGDSSERIAEYISTLKVKNVKRFIL